jgi:thiosulfate/3-mercaptopyruvate sulfurtransferase
VSGSPLIDVVRLHALIAEPGTRPTILDVRWELTGPPGRQEYDKGHIPGAAFVDLDDELAAPPGPAGRHPLPSADAFEKSMRAAGVSASRQVVVYDAATSMAAARAWWLLRYFGHDRVAVLDGGLAAWRRAGLPLETAAPHVAAGDFTARAGGMPLLDADAAGRLAATGVLLDARAPERFRGEQEPIDPVAGHIPGARSRPSARNVGPEGRFLDAPVLREAFAELGARDGSPVGAYCGSGVVAAHEVLALELAGIPAALYVGSWSEWITDPSRPVATGPDG